MGDNFEVIMAAYPSAGHAEQDFGALVKAVQDKQVRTEGVILVTRGADGRVTVSQTGDHLGRRGVGWGGGVGLVAGLFSPPLLASIVVGGAAGGLIGKFAEHRVASGIEKGLGDKLRPGTAVIVAIVDDDDRLAAERALGGSVAKSVVPSSKSAVRGLKDELALAAGKFSHDRSVLPIPDRTFGGVMGRTMKESVPDWSMIPGPKAPEGAPNVLLVLIDDAGFGAVETFGGPIASPTFTRVRDMGLTFNRFHVTAVCSPTRAAMLTGRNQHRVGFGSIAEAPAPFPGYTTSKPRNCTALPRILMENGYVTAGFGKWHLTPNSVQGAAGPFDHWPKSWGFNHWWGFLSGAAGQYDPVLTTDDYVTGVPDGKDGQPYYFPDDLTDKAIEWIHRVRAQDAEKPWFVYYSTGCAHAPHQVAKAWADKYKSRFDGGWDALREQILARQKELGVVPADTELTPRPDAFPAWDSLDDTAKKLYARQMEVYCGYQENADWNVGRLLDAIEEIGDLDNTLIIYIWGDNGASLEGTTTGSFNELTFLNGLVLDAAKQTELIEEYGGIEALGSDHTAPHCAAAWAHACNTPFQWGKQVASHLGGTRNPMVIAWPSRITHDTTLRSQFTHCIDVAPTILEAAGIPEPTMVDGIGQVPMDGTSLYYTFGDASAPERHTVQYFEMFGSRAVYSGGWWAASRPERLPWDLSPQTLTKFGVDTEWDPDRDVGWELYDLSTDFSQARDVAAEQPHKVAELRDLWWKEAERNQVLPLMAGLCIQYGVLPPLPTQTRFSYSGDVQNLLWGMIPRIYGRSYAIEGDLVVPDGGAEGVIVAMADFIGGFALWVDRDSILRHTYSMLGVDTYQQSASRPLPTGDVRVKMLFEAEKNVPGTGGHVTLFVNDEAVGEGHMPQTVPVTFTTYSAMDIGCDNGLVVDLGYEDKAPYAFTGTVKNVVFDLQPAAHDEEQAMHAHLAHQEVAAGVAG